MFLVLRRPARLPGPALLALLLALVTPPAVALELGFEAYTSVVATDNVGGDDEGDPDKEDALIGTAAFGVYGEQRSRAVSAGFEGEIDARRRLDDEDQRDVDTVTRFLGAAEFRLTPRALTWYVGDILGGVRLDDAVQPISDDTGDVRRRNVFVTGPELDYALDPDTRLASRLLYVNQSEEGDALETLWNASVDWRRDTTPGSYFGLSLSDIYTDNVEEETDDAGEGVPVGAGPAAADSDFNRVSAAAYWNRVRGFLELYGQIGATRYDTDEDSLNGLNAVLRATRTLGPDTTLAIELARDLSDQTLSTVESLVDDGTGLQPEAEGFFDETRVEAVYALTSTRTSADLGLGVARRDYRLLTGDDGVALAGANGGEDQVQGYAFGFLTRALTPRLRTELGARYERQSYDDRDDEADSILGSVRLVYRFARSFEVEAGYVFDRAEGVETRLDPASDALLREPIDVTENRATLGIRWAPPSRASRDLTIELKSLLR